MDSQVKDLVKAAKDFARTKNHGLSSRIRAKIDSMKPALAILASEHLSIHDIQEFIRRETGLKIGIVTLKRYLREAFNYPPVKSRNSGNSGQEKDHPATPKRRLSPPAVHLVKRASSH